MREVGKPYVSIIINTFGTLCAPCYTQVSIWVCAIYIYIRGISYSVLFYYMVVVKLSYLLKQSIEIDNCSRAREAPIYTIRWHATGNALSQKNKANFLFAGGSLMNGKKNRKIWEDRLVVFLKVWSNF